MAILREIMVALDYCIFKLDSTGNIEWQKSLGGNNEDRAKSVHQTLDNKFIITGFTFSNDLIQTTVNLVYI